MAYGPGDNPHAPKQRKRRRKKSTPVPGQTGNGSGPAPAKRPRSLHNKVADALNRTAQSGKPGTGGRPRPAAPSPAVKEQHAAKARQAPRARRAKEKLKSEQPAVRTARKNRASAGAALVEKLHHKTIAETRPERKAESHPDVAAHLEATREEQKTERTRELAREREERKPKKKKGGGGVLGFLGNTVKKVYGGDDDGDGGGGREATSRGAGTGFVGGVAQGLPAKVSKNVGFAIAEDPKRQLPKLAADTGKSIASIPAGMYALAKDPKKGIKGIAEDYARRYGPLLDGSAEGEKKFRERLKKEGVAPEVIDLASAAAAGGATVGRGVQVAAKAGKLGERAERIATTRPNIRVSGGESKEQKVHDNFGTNVLAAGRDAARKKVQGKRADRETAPLEVRQAEAHGEVTHIRRGATKRAQRKGVAEPKGRRFAQMKAEGAAETGAAGKNIAGGKVVNRAGLNKHERRGLKVAMDFGIHTAEAARRHLPDWIAYVRKNREELERSTGKTHPTDNVPELEWLVEHADEVFTPKLAAVAREEGERAARIAREDPGVDDAATVRRRHIAQSELLGEGRALTDEEAEAAIRAAEDDVKKAKADLAKAEKGEGVAQGRAQILSRGVGGTRAERAAARRNGAEFEAGGRGVEIAAGDVEGARAVVAEAEQRLARARKVEREGGYDVQGTHVPASEFDADQIARISRRAREEGLEQPAYFPSEERPAGVFSAFAPGGKKAVKASSKRYQGKLLRTGRENMDAEAHILSIQKGIKRKHNWNLVADQFDSHAVEWSKNQPLNELMRELRRRHIDPDTVAFWNPGRFRSQRHALDDDVDIQDPTFEARNIQDAMADSAVDAQGAAAAQFQGTTGWSIIPREVYEEIHADVRPSGKVGRSYDIAKGKLSRIMLANPAWLQFQVGSNALMTGLAGVGPVDALKAQRWWKSLDDAQRREVESYIGVHDWYDEQRHLGAASNAKLVNAYRAFKTTPFYRTVHKGNPFNLLFRADNAQNNFFRKAVLYNRAKREAYRRMGVEGGRALAAQKRIVDILKLTEPGDQMRALLRDGRELEKHAKAVRDFLGDWTTYTAKERKVFARSVMFYGFVRFSIRLAFYTMPIEHPVMAGILLQLGRLENDELEKIFGGNVPAWEIGNYFDGHGGKLATARLNPFFNAMQYAGKSPGAAVGPLGPLASVALNQIAGKNVAFDKLYTTRGSTSYKTKGADLNFEDRLRIAASELLKVSPYYRVASRIGLEGRQTDDALLFSPRPTGAPALGEKSHDPGTVVKESFLPLAGESGQEAVEASRQLAGVGASDVGGPEVPDIPDIPILKLPPLPPVHPVEVR